MVPKHYNIQMQHQMLVLGHKTMLFWSYNPDHPEPDQQNGLHPCAAGQRHLRRDHREGDRIYA